MTTRKFDDQLRAVILAKLPCEAGWRRFLRYLKIRGFVATIIDAQLDVARNTESYLRSDYNWLSWALQLPSTLIDNTYLFNKGFRVMADDCWRILEAYSIKPYQIVEKVKEAYKALKPSDRARRTWAQRRKS